MWVCKCVSFVNMPIPNPSNLLFHNSYFAFSKWIDIVPAGVDNDLVLDNDFSPLRYIERELDKVDIECKTDDWDDTFWQ
jgi:hypothetical protein